MCYHSMEWKQLVVREENKVVVIGVRQVLMIGGGVCVCVCVCLIDVSIYPSYLRDMVSLAFISSIPVLLIN